MDKSLKKVIYITNIFPSYRKELWKELLSLKKVDFKIYFSYREFQGIGSASIDSFFKESERKKLYSLKNINLFGHIWWQRGILRTLISKDYDSVIFLGDMKIISNWIGMIICKLRGKKIVLWTHGTYGNEKPLKKTIRYLFLNLADSIFLYEKRAKRILLRNNFLDEKLHVVYNSINLNKQTKVYQSLDLDKKNLHNINNYNLVFFGRLTNVKRIDLAIKAVIELNRKFQKFSLKIVGDGPQEEYLKKIVCNADANEYISFEKGKYCEHEIGQMFMKSDLLVSPGNIGLNAVHSILYGTPVLTHGDFNNQMPECEIIEEGFNGIFHEKDNLISLKAKIEQWFSSNFDSWNRDKIRKKLIKKYNPIYQAAIIEKALLNK
jgi:glycosyltransferase involved in cell wall biosynthesis